MRKIVWVVVLVVWGGMMAKGVWAVTGVCGFCGTKCTRVTSGMVCPYIGVEGRSCVDVGGKCTVLGETKVTGPVVSVVRPSVTSTIGCYYKEVQCYREPCYPVLECPSVTPTKAPIVASVTCIPRPACLDMSSPCKIKMPEGGVYCPVVTGVVECKTDADCPPDNTCRVTPIGGCPTRIVNGITQYIACAHSPRCYPKVTPTGSQTCKTDADCPPNNTCRVTPIGGCPTIVVNGISQESACAHPPRCYPNVTIKPLMGDANGDGRVDMDDFVIWKSEYLSGQKGGRADFNKDGTTNLVDFSIWKKYYLVSSTNSR